MVFDDTWSKEFVPAWNEASTAANPFTKETLFYQSNLPRVTSELSVATSYNSKTSCMDLTTS